MLRQSTASLRQPLTVALLSVDFRLQNWQAEALVALQQEGVIRVTRLAACAPCVGRFETLACASLAWAETLMYKHGDRPEGFVDARPLFPEATAARQAPSLRSDRPPGVDLAVNCGVEERSCGIVARLGTLSCDFRGSPSLVGVYRTLLGDGGTLPLAVRLRRREREVVVERAWPALPPRPLFHEAMRTVCRRAGALLTKAVRDIASGEMKPHSAPPDGTPAAARIDVPALGRYARRRIADSFKARSRKISQRPTWADDDNNWFLAYRTNPEHFVCNTERFSSNGLQLMLPPKDRFYADPCVVEHQGREHIFLEEWNLADRKGVIAWTRVENGRPGAVEPVLKRPYHLSYPFVFEAGKDVFMIPESAAARRVELYRAVDFPTRWEPAEILLDNVVATDATVHELDGRWWMFVTVGEQGSSRYDQLFLYHADNVHGPWRPHKRNPVKIDVRSARPAGRLFQRGGKLIRPTQDCSVRYGGALTLCEVKHLSLLDYAEVAAEKLLPDWLPMNIGFHTLSHCARLEVIDGKMLPGKTARFPGAIGLSKTNTGKSPQELTV